MNAGFGFGKRKSGEVVVVPAKDFDERVAQILAEALRGEERSGPVNLTLAGGGTPRGAYECLSKERRLAWEEVEVFFGDERAVPPDHPDSNYRMAMESLLSRVPVSPERVHRMEGDQPDLEAAATRYERLLPATLGILVLGLGKDGHTASLFPGGDPVGETSRRVMPAQGPIPPRRRLTITPPVIQGAHRIFVLARGSEKAHAVAQALYGDIDPVQCPAQLARDGTWILDESAGEELPLPENGRNS